MPIWVFHVYIWYISWVNHYRNFVNLTNLLLFANLPFSAVFLNLRCIMSMLYVVLLLYRENQVWFLFRMLDFCSKWVILAENVWFWTYFDILRLDMWKFHYLWLKGLGVFGIITSWCYGEMVYLAWRNQDWNWSKVSNLAIFTILALFSV